MSDTHTARPVDANGRVAEFIFDHAPRIAAAMAFLGGLSALFAATTPEGVHIPGLDVFDRLIEEAPEFVLSVSGVALMALAYGLGRRLDAAFAAALVLLAHATIYSLLRTQDYVAAGLYAALAVFLLASRRAFYRHAGLSSALPSPRWTAAIAAGLAAASVSAVLWASDRPGFAEAPWWALIFDPHLGRGGRAAAAALVAGAALLTWSAFLSPARGVIAPADAADLARARTVMALAQRSRPDQGLALLGDKTFIFTPGDEAFVMYARGGGSLVAMGAPVGKRSAWRSALVAFRAEAERVALRPVVYAAPPDLLPELIDLGFRVEKVGESALVDLKTFSLGGKARQNLRTSRRRLAEREGATFEIEQPLHGEERFAALQATSDAWLAAQKGGEKGFSLGRFDRDYLAGQPIGAVRVGGRVVAFANLLTTPDRVHVAIDLMRHDHEAAPPGTMDFLITELLLWAQGEGYSYFDLGMAPLSGLAEERFAPLFARFGRFVFERGEAFYGFEGLRRFKDKFDPIWEPRYIAAPGAWALPLVLAEVGLLTSSAPRSPRATVAPS